MPHRPGVSAAQTHTDTNQLNCLSPINKKKISTLTPRWRHCTHIKEDDLLDCPELLTLCPQILTVLVQHQRILLRRPAQIRKPLLHIMGNEALSMSMWCLCTSKSLGWNMFLMITTFSCLFLASPCFSGLQSNCLHRQRHRQEDPIMRNQFGVLDWIYTTGLDAKFLVGCFYPRCRS